MKTIFFAISILFVQLSQAQTLTGTFTSSDISTSFNTYEISCYGSNVININLPSGGQYIVNNVNVAYSMTAIGSGWMADQRSQIAFLNTNTVESTEAIGVGSVPGTFNYNRNISIANGTYSGGTSLSFQLRTRRVFEGTPGCNTATNYVNNNSWTITVNYIQVGKVGINNTDPATALDIKGALRVRPTYLPVISNVLSIPDNTTNVIIEQGGTGSFTTNMGLVYEGQILYIDNLYGYSGTLPGGADIPLGVSQFIFSDGEWKQTPTPNIGSGPSDGWSLNGNGGTSTPTNFIGTTDNEDILIKRNNIEKVKITNNGIEVTNQDNAHVVISSGSTVTDTSAIILRTRDVDNTGVDFKIASEPVLDGLPVLKIEPTLYDENESLQFKGLSVGIFGDVGVGTYSPFAKFEVSHRAVGNASISIADSSANNTSGGLLEFRNIDDTHNFGIRALLGTNPAGTDSYLQFSKNGFYHMRLRGDGNLGIGTGGFDPNLAGLTVNKKVGNVNAVFGDNTSGVSIESAFPGIHLNSYYNASRKMLSTGFTSGMEMDPSSGGIVFYTSPSSAATGATASVFTRMLINKDGNVGINVPSPTNKLEISGTTKSTQFLVTHSLSEVNGINVDISSGSSNTGIFSNAATGIWASGSGTGGVGLYASAPVSGFGIHSVGKVKIDNQVIINDAILNMYKGTTKTIEINPKETATTGAEMKLMNAAGVVTIELDADFNDGDGRVITSELQINGGSDLSENFDLKDDDYDLFMPGMLVAIDEITEGKITITKIANDTKVIGVISGANGIKPGMLMGQKETIADGNVPIALAGRVFVLTTDEIEINAGDFLVSSSKPGYATKAVDPSKCQGAIIGKAMGKRNKETGFVLVLVNLQ